jgi:hypothetical protein
MKVFCRLARTTVQLCGLSLAAIYITGCVTTQCGSSDGTLPDGSNPVNCPSIAVDVTTANNPSGCIVNPGVSKKCSTSTAKCPHDTLGPKLCKTKVGPGGNCSCTCGGT